MALLGYGLVYFAGCVTVGWVAHRWPHLFARVDDAGAAVVNKASDAVQKEVSKQ